MEREEGREKPDLPIEMRQEALMALGASVSWRCGRAGRCGGEQAPATPSSRRDAADYSSHLDTRGRHWAQRPALCSLRASKRGGLRCAGDAWPHARRSPVREA